MKFTDITLQAGSKTSTRHQDSSRLLPAAVDIFTRMIRGRENFREPIPVPKFRHIELQWTTEDPSAALATFWTHGTILTTSILLAGLDPEHEEAAIGAMQSIITQIYHQTAMEPGFDLLSIKDRPLIATLIHAGLPIHADDLAIVADMETCLAAAFFLQSSRKGE